MEGCSRLVFFANTLAVISCFSLVIVVMSSIVSLTGCHFLISSLRPTLKHRLLPRRSWRTAPSSNHSIKCRACWVTRLWSLATPGLRRTSQGGTQREPKDWTLGRREQWRSSISSLNIRGWSGICTPMTQLECTWLQQNVLVRMIVITTQNNCFVVPAFSLFQSLSL